MHFLYSLSFSAILKKVHFLNPRHLARCETQVFERSQKYLHYFACVTEISAIRGNEHARKREREKEIRDKNEAFDEDEERS